TDEQSGSGGGAASTSVVSQGDIAKTLSAAVEYGALTQSVSGQVITIRGNLAGLPSALVRNNVLPYCEIRSETQGQHVVQGRDTNPFCLSGGVLNGLRRVSFGVSFDASRDSESLNGTATGGAAQAQQVTFTGKKREVTAASGRIEIWNRRDVTS